MARQRYVEKAVLDRYRLLWTRQRYMDKRVLDRYWLLWQGSVKLSRQR